MNINDLKPNEYKVLDKPTLPKASGLNINTLPKGSFSTVTKPVLPPAQTPLEQVQSKMSPNGGRSVASGIMDYVKTAWNDTGKAFQELPGKITNDFQESAKDVVAGTAPGRTDTQQADWQTSKGLAKGFLRPAGDIIGAAITPLTSMFGKAMQDTGAQKGLEDLSKFLVGDTSQTGSYDEKGNFVNSGNKLTDQKWFQDFAVKHTNAEEDFQRLMNLSIAAGADPIKALEDLKKGTGKTVDAIKTHIEESAKLKEAKNAVANIEKAPDLAAKITQTVDKGDIKTATKALPTVKLEGIKDSAEASARTEAQIKANVKAVDEAYAKDTTPHKPAEFDKQVKVSNELTRDPKTGKMISNYEVKNPITDAITQLKDYYEKSGNTADYQKMLDIEAKFKNEGLTAQEINNLARQHGRDLNAYNANNELSSGLKKESAENTRKSVKAEARKFAPETEAIDAQIADQIKLKQMFDDMTEKFQRLKNTVEPAGPLKKLGSFVGVATNVLTGRFFEGFFKKLIPDFNNLGADTKLNIKDVQKKLAPMIEEFNKILKETEGLDPVKAKAKLEELMKNKGSLLDIFPKSKGAIPKIAKPVLPPENAVAKISSELKSKYPNAEIVLKQGKNGGVHLDMLAIKHAERGKGLGTKIMNDFTRLLDENNLKSTLELDTKPYDHEVPRLQKFYEKSGYKEPLGKQITDRGEMIRFHNQDKIVPQIKEKLKIAPEAKKYIDNLATDIAEKHNATVAKAPVKTFESSLRKTNIEYNGVVDDVTDFARNTIIGENAQHVDIIAKDLEKQAFKFKHVKASDNPLGYTGKLAKIKTHTGMIAEVQVNTPDMIFAKEPKSSAIAQLGEEKYNALNQKYEKLGLKGGEGHVYYEKWRLVDPFSTFAQKIADDSTKYYANFRLK